MNELDEDRLRIAKEKGWRLFYEPPQAFPKDYPYYDFTHDERRIAWHIQNSRQEIDLLETAREMGDNFYRDLSRMDQLPDWPRDIEATYALEDEIPEDQRPFYVSCLKHIIKQDNPPEGYRWFAVIHATPAQRCRAWLIWKENQSSSS